MEQEDDVSIKKLLLSIQGWFNYLLRQWKIIIPVSIVGAAIGFAYSLTRKTQYIGELTFILEDTKSGGLGAYSGIASQLGIDLGGASQSGLFAGDNIIEFLRSRLMIEKTLLSPVSGKQSQSLAEMYLDVYKVRDSWKGTPLQDLKLPPVLTDRSGFRLKQDSVLNEIYNKLVKSHLVIAKPDKKLSFVNIRCTTENETFSKIFVERLVKEAIDFYIAMKTQRSKINVDKLQLRADSIESLLNKKTYSAAASQDMNLNPARRVATVNTELVTRDKTVLQTMYIEVVKNLEMSRYAMAQETPVIQIIDAPILPLKKEKFGKLKGIILGGFLAGFFITLFLVIKKIYKDIMAR